jgi:hypothetical protein
MAFDKEEERIYRELGNIDFLGRSLITQALILFQQKHHPEALAGAGEVYKLASVMATPHLRNKYCRFWSVSGEGDKV